MRQIIIFLALASGALAQPPDCQINAINVTTTGIFPNTNGLDNRLAACQFWTLQVSSNGFTGLSVTLQSAPGANAPGTWVTYIGTVSTGVNPIVSTTGAVATFSNGTASIPWIRLNVASLTGTGQISVVLLGYRTQSAGGGGGGMVGSITSPNSTLSLSGCGTNFTNCLADINLANANTWTARQTFTNATFTNAPTFSSLTSGGTQCAQLNSSGVISGTGSPCGSGGTSGITQLTGDVAAGPGSGSQAATIQAGAVTLAKMANLAADSIICNNTGSGATPIACTVAQVNTLLGGPITINTASPLGGGGTISPGSTLNLTCTGCATGAGVTSLNAIAGALTIMSSGGSGIAISTSTPNISVSLATIANGDILSNISGSTAIPIANTLSGIMDSVFGNTQGNILQRTASGWAALGPGTLGQFLESGGPSANNLWGSPTGSGTVNSCGTANAMAFYAATGTTVSCDPNIIDQSSSGAAGGLNFYYGTTGTAATGAALWQAATSGTTFSTFVPSAPGTGLMLGSYSSPNETLSYMAFPTLCSGGQVSLGLSSGSNNCAAPFTLTTTGTSGAATFSAGTLNIPQYTGGSGGCTSSANNVLQKGNGSGGCISSSVTDNGTTVATGESIVQTGTTSIQVGSNGLYDSNGLPFLTYISAPSTVDYVSINPDVMGGNPSIIVVGADTNSSLVLAGKGTGSVWIVDGKLRVGASGVFTGAISVDGATSGSAVITSQATAGTPTLTLPNASGTFAVTASSPLALNATTGNLTCPSCTGGGGGTANSVLTDFSTAVTSGTVLTTNLGVYGIGYAQYPWPSNITWTLAQYTVTSITSASQAVLTITGGTSGVRFHVGDTYFVSGATGTGCTGLNGLQTVVNIGSGTVTVNYNSSGCTYTGSSATLGANPSASGTGFIYGDNQGNVTMMLPASAGVIAGPAVSSGPTPIVLQSSTPGFGAGSWPIATFTINSTGNGNYNAVSDQRIFAGTTAFQVGAGLLTNEAGGIWTTAIDPSVVPELGAGNLFTASTNQFAGGTIVLGASGQPACIEAEDVGGASVTYVTFSSGVITASSTKPMQCP